MRSATQLGELEAEAMKVLWSMGRGTVQDVVSGLKWQKDLAYTTVMTVLGRLLDKGFLTREKDGRAYIYRPRVSRESIADSALRIVVDRFFGGVSSRAVAHLLGRTEAIDEKTLARLELAVRRKRSERAEHDR